MPPSHGFHMAPRAMQLRIVVVLLSSVLSAFSALRFVGLKKEEKCAMMVLRVGVDYSRSTGGSAFPN